MSAQTPKPLPPEVILALQRGNLIEAIKLLRAAGNFDLKQAKEAIEQHLDRGKVGKATVSEAVGSLLSIPGIADALRKGNKIDAIRILREKTGLGLTEAKDAIDRNPGHSTTSTSYSSAADGDAPRFATSEKPQQTLSRPGLSPGEVPHSGAGRWLFLAVVVAAALAYYLYTRIG